ncbi:hypothetical protein KI387_037488, partial [Taxus chinensis]
VFASGFSMEDEETGEFLLPCRLCSERCFKNRSKHKNRECYNGCAYFFKIMLGDYAEKLRVPPAFVPKLTIEVGENVVLQGPSGEEWVVKLWGTDKKLEFSHGWENFVHHHGIEFGDFLVFKYICESNFKVRIFGRNGCVKNITVCEHKKINTDGERMDGKEFIDLVSEECNVDAKVMSQNQRRKAEPFSH